MAAGASSPKDLLEIESIQPALRTASGISDKAGGHLLVDTQQEAIENLIQNFLDPAGDDFVDELVFRFLLTKGDSLGGRMRNLAGQLAEQQFIRSLIATISVQGRDFLWFDSKAKKWIEGNDHDPVIELRARGVSWTSRGRERTLLLNSTLRVLRKNVDLCLLDAKSTDIQRGRGSSSAHHVLTRYLALGELKGGIDPAGADEHWKTANSALSRIQFAFGNEGHHPDLFFIGAAIANSMAQEIYGQLASGRLTFAANLTNEEQLVDLCDWLTSI